MRKLAYLCIALVLLVSSTSGCQMFPGGDIVAAGHSPLQPAPHSPESISTEIVWARFPAGDPGLNDTAWQDIDETQIEPAIRRELANNGFRAGVISGTLPVPISRVLNQKEAAGQAKAKGKEQSIDLLAEPMVRARLLQARRGRRNEIQASEVYPTMPLLIGDGRELGGSTYHDAQAIYALTVSPRADHAAEVQLTPELHYGSPRLRWTSGEEYILRQAPLRDRRVFDQMRMTVRLAPGDMLVLMSLPDAGSRLGHYFHTVDAAEGQQQKVILLRLAEVPASDTFANSSALQ
jgi:hypothetical protein